MSVGTAVRDALDRAASERTAFLTLSQLSERLGGTRATAAALGITQRSVQRYLKAERGESGQTRRPGRQVAPRLYEVRERASRRETAKQLRANGLLITHFVGEVTDPSGRSRERDKSDLGMGLDAFDMEAIAEAMEELSRAYEEGDEDALGDAFAIAFFGAWGGANMPAGPAVSGGFSIEGEPLIDFAIPEG